MERMTREYARKTPVLTYSVSCRLCDFTMQNIPR